MKYRVELITPGEAPEKPTQAFRPDEVGAREWASTILKKSTTPVGSKVQCFKTVEELVFEKTKVPVPAPAK